MSKKVSRTLILGLVLGIAIVSYYFRIYFISCYFSATFGFLLGIIAMKERDNLGLFALSRGILIDGGDLDESDKGKDAKGGS